MKVTRFIILAMLTLLWAGIASAQGGVINYGETRTETLSPGTPQLLYSLNGNAGEVVTVYVLSWTETMQPSITILGPTGQLAFTSTDALTPIRNDARVTAALPQAGNYSILVGSTTSALETFTIAVRLSTPGISTQLGPDPVTINIPPGGESVSYTIVPAPDGDTPITVASGTPDFMYAVQLRAPDGRVVMATDGALPSVSAVIPAGTEPYTLIIRASDPAMGGAVTVAQSTSAPASPPSTSSTAPNPVVTEEVSAGNPPPPNECAAIAGAGGLNVRLGPGTNYDVLRVLGPNDYLIVTGQNSGWYTDGVGWVAGGVVTLAGPCDALGIADFNAGPAATPVPPTATTQAPPTQDNTDTTQPTATTAATATTAPTATTAVQTAVIDSNQLNFSVDRDNGGTYTNDVSFPNGDTTDRIRMTIDNLFNQPPNNYREFNIIVTCAGPDAANLRWGTGGPNSPSSRGCNESISGQHTDQSNQTFLNINMTGDGYVQYTIIVTITS